MADPCTLFDWPTMAVPFDLFPPGSRSGAHSALIGVLGPTNTGKTHFAIERMLAHRTGVIGLPLRLLAREVYDRLVARLPARSVALVTGEEKIVPPTARYWVSTVEAMPLDRNVEFVAIDEIQLAADPERGRVFTSRLVSARGAMETLFLGSETMRPILKRLYPDMFFVSKERFSNLAYAGAKKVTRLPRRTAIVAFSADTVYAIAELVRRQRGGAAVVLGALSPRTRNAQADLYQNGEVDYLIATDAIGMGLNMDIDHVAFAATTKFDGRGPRSLRADELAQIAGRAGRHIRDGAFGVTGTCRPLDDDIVAAIEAHRFDPVEALQWRSDVLDFASVTALRRSLDRASPRPEFQRARPDDDEEALLRLASFPEIRERATSVAATGLLWEVCQIPDFRKIALDQHTRLLADIYDQLIDAGRVAEAWLEPRVEALNRVDGDIDAVSARIAHVRTWTYLSNRAGWVQNAPYWQEKTRSIEDALSDALHEKLTQRFVDRRTSVLQKRLRDEAPLMAGVSEDGEVIVEGQFVGRLLAFEFFPDPRAKGVEARKVRYAAERALAPVLAVRAAALVNAPETELTLTPEGAIQWRASTVATLAKGPAPLRPELRVKGLDAIPPNLQGRVQDRLQDFFAARVETLLHELLALKRASDGQEGVGLTGMARGVAYRLVENFGAMSRAQIADDIKTLTQDERGKLRSLGVRFGEYTIHLPSLLKPAPARMLTMLWALWTGRQPEEFPPPKAGLVSLAMPKDFPHEFFYASGYRPSGERAVRIDMLERLAGQIRTAREGRALREGFEANSQMMSIVGCSGEDFEAILRSLGYRKETIRRPVAAPLPPTSVVGDAPGPEERALENVADPVGVDETSADKSAPTPAEPAATAEMAPPQDPVSETDTLPPDANTAPAVEAPVDEAPVPEASVAEPHASNSPITDDLAETALAESAAGPPASVSAETVEVVVWRMPPRRPIDRPRARPAGAGRDSARAGAPGGDARPDARRGERNERGRPPQKAGGPPAGSRDGQSRPRYEGDRSRRDDGRSRKDGANSRPDNDRQRRQNAAPPPRRERIADPDSPFAVLAALKAELSSRDGGPQKK